MTPKKKNHKLVQISFWIHFLQGILRSEDPGLNALVKQTGKTQTIYLSRILISKEVVWKEKRSIVCDSL